jgi:hypothetical protein
MWGQVSHCHIGYISTGSNLPQIKGVGRRKLTSHRDGDIGWRLGKQSLQDRHYQAELGTGRGQVSHYNIAKIGLYRGVGTMKGSRVDKRSVIHLDRRKRRMALCLSALRATHPTSYPRQSGSAAPGGSLAPFPDHHHESSHDRPMHSPCNSRLRPRKASSLLQPSHGFGAGSDARWGDRNL